MTEPSRPRDVGNGLVCASFGTGGEWLSFSTVDPDDGFVELTGLPPFDPEWRGIPDLVRRYRSWMVRDDHGFIRFDAGQATVASRQDAPRNTRSVVQRLTFSAGLPYRPLGVHIRATGRLTWPEFAEITETDPPTAEGAKSRMKAREGALRINGQGAPVVVQVWRRDGREGAQGSAHRRSDARIEWTVQRRRIPTAEAYIEWPADADELHIDVACTFDGPVSEDSGWLDEPRQAPPADAQPAWKRPLPVPARLVKPLGRMNQRAASYTRGCTALQVSDTERTILADHRMLPLSWTRDAYWQARLMLASWARGGHDDDLRLVADHLRWLFLRCERPDGRWVRSHHADGRRKDHPFQADQQLYPLLELTDYISTAGQVPQLPADEDWAGLAVAAWNAAASAIDPALGLIRTDENPADDVPTHPFLLSDQVLLWHVAKRLSTVASDLGLEPEPLESIAASVREAVASHFVVEGPSAQQWAYAVDGAGSSELYMDANDLPVAMAPIWGFCEPTDELWRATMRYAFDPANDGFVLGPMGGLGSRHTSGTWTLGDIMGWVAFGLMEERDAADGMLERLTQVAYDDGMLPEAFDPETGEGRVRRWFAWPGAALGTLLLDHAARDSGD